MKARRSCLRFAGMPFGGLERNSLACLRRELRTCLGSGGEVASEVLETLESFEAGASLSISEVSLSMSSEDFEDRARILRVARRSAASFRAPVA